MPLPRRRADPLIPAWSANATYRAVSTPKLVFTASGLATYLLTGVGNDVTTGGLIETFVLGDRDGHEVDAVLENNAGRVIGIEVKAAETVRAEDFRGLRHLESRLGDRFAAGYVLYCGDQQLPFGEKFSCLPISALWTTPPG